MNMNRIESPTDLLLWREGIIESVVSNGLIPRVTLESSGKVHLGSADRDSRERVYGWSLPLCLTWKPGIPDSERHYINREDFFKAFYRDEDSILPVLYERPGEPPRLQELRDSAKRNLFCSRSAAAFLVVCRSDYKITKSFLDQYNNVPPSKIAYLIFPEDILEEFRRTSLAKIPHSVPVRTISDMTTRYIGGLFPVDVVDYESGLNQVADEIGEAIWVHGVRLPTEEDLRRLQLT